MIYDKKNRQYELLGFTTDMTFMKCLATGSRIQVANHYFTAGGFRYA